MLNYGYDPENPALDERLEAKPRDEDKEYMELYYTYQALLEEVRRLYAAERVREAATEKPPSNAQHPQRIPFDLGTVGRKLWASPTAPLIGIP